MFLVRNDVVPHIIETIYSSNGLAGAFRLQFPNGLRRTKACVYSKISGHDKQEVNPFLDSMKRYDILMQDYNDDLCSSNPTRP